MGRSNRSQNQELNLTALFWAVTYGSPCGVLSGTYTKYDMLVNCGGRNPAITETEAGDPLLPSLSAVITVSKYSLSLTNGKPVVLIQPVSFSTPNLSSPPKRNTSKNCHQQEHFYLIKIRRKIQCQLPSWLWLRISMHTKVQKFV